MSQDYGKEHRRGTRFKHDSFLEIFDEQGRLLEGVSRLVDVSSVGASFATTRVLAKGDLIRGRLRVFGALPFDVTGRVVRARERANDILYAIEFETAKKAHWK